MKVSPENAVAELTRVHEVLRLLRKEFGEWQSQDFPLLGFDVLRVWHCVRAVPGMDIRFANDLNEQGYETYLAKMLGKHECGEQTFHVWKLRFSPYVFVAVDYSRQEFHPITETLGYEDVLSFNFIERDGVRTAQPSVVPRETILGMRHDEDEDAEAATRRVRKEESLYSVGDMIRILREGPLYGRELPIDEVRSGSLIARRRDEWPVRLKEREVEPVDPHLLRDRAAERAAAAKSAKAQKASTAA